MNIGRRSFSLLFNRLTEPYTYSAIARMPSIHRHPWRVLWRELFVRNGYPLTLDIRTPIGPRTVHLYVPEDLSTLNSVFCRHDYGTPHPLRTVVDFGSNIGLSGLFWLTRTPETRAYLYEPVPRLFERLKLNLRGLEDRFTAEQAAVSNREGTVEFGVEPTGREGGIGIEWTEKSSVRCMDARQILRDVIQRHGSIDCLKVDIEGHEDVVFESIEPDIWKRLRYVTVEDAPEKTRRFVPDYFRATKQIAVMHYTNTRFQEA